MFSQAETAQWGAQGGGGGGSSSPSRWDNFSICFVLSLECLNASWKKSPHRGRARDRQKDVWHQTAHLGRVRQNWHSFTVWTLPPVCPCTFGIQTSGFQNQLLSGKFLMKHLYSILVQNLISPLTPDLSALKFEGTVSDLWIINDLPCPAKLKKKKKEIEMTAAWSEASLYPSCCSIQHSRREVGEALHSRGAALPAHR